MDRSFWLGTCFSISVCRIDVSHTEIKDEIPDTRYERPTNLEGGDVAQLGERRPRTAEASGSIPLISTNY